MRVLLLLLAGVATSACSQEISLGTECPNSRGACPRIAPDGTGADEAESPREGDATIDRPAPGGDDGGFEPIEFDGGPSDAGTSRPLRDATVTPRDSFVPMEEEDAGPALFPSQIRNPSFELVDGGMTGDLPGFDLIGIRPTQIDPWYTCRPAGTGVWSRSPLRGPDGSTEGNTYLTFTFSVNPTPILNGLAQNLAEPLRAGQHYAFAFDAWSELDPTSSSVSASLDVVAGGLGTCIIGFPMASSDPIDPGGWHKVCVRFTPQLDVRTIILIPNTPSIISALHIENIRPDPTCGNY